MQSNKVPTDPNVSQNSLANRLFWILCLSIAMILIQSKNVEFDSIIINKEQSQNKCNYNQTFVLTYEYKYQNYSVAEQYDMEVDSVTFNKFNIGDKTKIMVKDPQYRLINQIGFISCSCIIAFLIIEGLYKICKLFI